jgi:eukaryotic-like serine/threonine-protein kinase
VNDQTGRDAKDCDERLADHVASLAERIAQGEPPDVGHLETIASGDAEAVERLLPTIRLLSELADNDVNDAKERWSARPPDVMGDFQLGREIGRGGIGVVYEATQISLGRRVAVKVLPPASLLDPRHLRRFEIEAQAAAALQHPNIVPVYAYGTECGVPYFAMRLIDGRNLADVVRERLEQNGSRPGAREVAELGRQAAEALDYAHRNDVLHRDIKPSNLLIDANQRVWIADFGLARIRTDSELTASGDVLGTLRYLSPEQAKGRRGIVDGRTDIYGLGATLFELLTLRPIYEGDERAELLVKIVSEEPHFSRKLDAAIPLDLRTIVLKALAREPAERYPTAADLAADLSRFLAGVPIEARRATSLERTWRWCLRNKVVAASMGAVAVSLLAATIISVTFGLRAERARQAEEIRGRSEAKARQDAVDARRGVQRQLIDLSAQSGLTAAHEGDDGLALLWFSRAAQISGDHPERQELNRVRCANWLRRVWTPEGTFAVGGFRQDADQFRDLRFSPDGNYLLAAATRGELIIWDRQSGRRVTPPGANTLSAAAAWEPNTGRLAVGGSDGKIRLLVPPAFETAEELTAGDGVTIVAFSNDARKIAWGGPKGARVWDREKKNFLTPFLPHAGPVATLAFSTDGTLLATSARDMKARVYRIPSTQLEPLFPPVPHFLAEYGINHGGPGRVAPRFADHDTVLLTVDLRGVIADLQWRSATTGEVLTTTTGAIGREYLGAFDVSADGERVAATWSDGYGRLLEARKRAVLAAIPLDEHYWCEDVVFSADGKFLVSGGHGMKVRTYLVDGEQDLSLLPAMPPISHSRQVVRVALSRDNQHLAAALWDGTVCLWRWPEGPPIAYNVQASGPTWLTLSPDRRHLLPKGTSFRSSTMCSTRVYDATSGDAIGPKLDPDGIIVDAAFSPDGAQVAIAALTAQISQERERRIFLGEGKAGNVQFWDWRTGRRGHDPTPLPAEPRGIAYSPDGRRLAVVCADYRVVLVDPSTGAVQHHLDPGIRTRPFTANLWTTNGAAVFNSDGRFLMTWERVPTVHIWDPESGRLLHSLDHTDRIENAVFHPTIPHILATGGRNSTLTVWDVITGKRLLELPHAGWVQTLMFSPDGNELISGCTDGLMRTWNWRTGELKRGLSHNRSLINYDFTGDRHWLAVVGIISLELTDWRSGMPAGPEWSLRDGLRWSVKIPAGDRRAIVGGFDGIITGYDLEKMTKPASATPEHLTGTAEIVAGRRITNDGNVVPLSTAEWTQRWEQQRRAGDPLDAKSAGTSSR